MIVDMIRGNIFETSHSNIAFAINTQGFNDAGFAGQVSSLYWKRLSNTGEKNLGDTLSHEANGKNFYALVCHSLDNGGWEKTPETVTECLDSLNVSEAETIAIVLMGAGMIGQMGGANVFAILGGIARSKKKVVVYTL